MAEYALACIARMDTEKLDFTMLWLVKHWDWLSRFKAGLDLRYWIENSMGLHRQEVCCEEFHNQVTKVHAQRGVRRIAPSRMVWAIRKAELYDKVKLAAWPKPYFPFMIQTRPPVATEEELKSRDGFRRAGVFVMFSNWQDGFFKIIEIASCHVLKDQNGNPLRDYSGEIHQVAILYENQITKLEGRDCPCRIILDCDLSCAKFEDRFSLDDMIKSTEQVPIWFVKRLAEINAIKKTDVVVVIEKDKSRPGKVSKHYTFNLLGLSKGEIFQVLNEIFKKPFMAKKKGLKVTASVDYDGLIEPYEIADTSTMHGNNQFSTVLMHDPKKKESRNPVQTVSIKISNGGTLVERKKTPWARVANDPDHPHAMHMLALSCYTNFTANSILLDQRFMTFFHEGKHFIALEISLQ
jgi:hypothetical protein